VVTKVRILYFKKIKLSTKMCIFRVVVVPKLLADAKNHKVYTEYQHLIDQVKLAKDPIVAEWLELARVKRMKQEH